MKKIRCAWVLVVALLVGCGDESLKFIKKCTNEGYEIKECNFLFKAKNCNQANQESDFGTGMVTGMIMGNSMSSNTLASRRK